jgi:hypothetical protein
MEPRKEADYPITISSGKIQARVAELRQAISAVGFSSATASHRIGLL